MIDIDGQFSNSKIISVRIANNFSNAQVYPNPTKDILYFNQASAYEIYDLQGKLIMKSKKPQNSVNTSELKSGIYLIKIGGEIMKFVVE